MYALPNIIGVIESRTGR